MGDPYRFSHPLYTKTEFDALLLGVKIPAYATEPTTPISGMIYRNTTDDMVYVYYASNWQAVHQ